MTRVLRIVWCQSGNRLSRTDAWRAQAKLFGMLNRLSRSLGASCQDFQSNVGKQNMAVLRSEPPLERGLFFRVAHSLEISCDVDIGMNFKKGIKRLINDTKHDGYTFYRVVGPLNSIMSA